MSVKRSILEAIQRASNGGVFGDDVFMTLCNVDSVDETNLVCQCTPVSGKAATQFPEVQLQPEVDDGFVCIPVVGSTVLVVYSKYHAPHIILFSAIAKVYCSPSTLFQFNDGSMGGLVQVINLVAKLNNLENLLNDLIAKYNSHTHILSLSSGTGTAAPTTTTETGSISPVTQRSDIENTKITHG